MSTVRVNDEIKKEIMPILNEIGISLSEAINIYLHQIKKYQGIPFNLRKPIELKDGKGSYICEYGYLHDYSKIDFEKIEKDVDKRTFGSVDELIEALEEETEDDV